MHWILCRIVRGVVRGTMFGSSRIVASTAGHLQEYKRCISTSRPLLAKALLYKEHGDPQKVVQYVVLWGSLFTVGPPTDMFLR